MKKALLLSAAIVSAATLLSGCGSFSLFSNPWEGTWWGVEDAGTNWTGDTIRTLETFTFTREGDAILVEHKTQRGGKEIEGSLTGTAVEDGGRLIVTPKDGSRETAFTYSRTGRAIETPLKNADGTPVTLRELTQENNADMEEARSAIVRVSQRAENAVDTTLSRRK